MQGVGAQVWSRCQTAAMSEGMPGQSAQNNRESWLICPSGVGQ